MTWNEFKKEVDEEIEKLGQDGTVRINSIVYSFSKPDIYIDRDGLEIR